MLFPQWVSICYERCLLAPENPLKLFAALSSSREGVWSTPSRHRTTITAHLDTTRAKSAAPGSAETCQMVLGGGRLVLLLVEISENILTTSVVKIVRIPLLHRTPVDSL